MSSTIPHSGESAAAHASVITAEAHWPFSDLDAALAEARARDKPVFAYWSTEWCPPCGEMRATVFRTAEFQARLGSVVALAIDGDAPLAQSAGDRLGTTVYPTMLLLGNDGEEWLRFPGGLRAATFCKVLDLAVEKRTPISVLASRLLGGEALDAGDFRLLAFHYWPQDGRTAAGDRRLGLLERLDERLPPQLEVEAARVFLWRLLETAAHHATDPASVAAPLRTHLHERLLSLLRSSQASYATLYYLIVGTGPVLGLLAPDSGAARHKLLDALIAALERVLDDTDLSATERLIALSTHADLTRKLVAPDELDARLRERVRATVERAEAQTSWPPERQSVMNMAGHLLKQCGFRGEAEALFRKATREAVGPTYFMPYLAEICIEDGRADEALDWWLRAYEETRGKNSRFALGVRYLAALIRHFPERTAQIEALATRLLGELGDDPDLTRGRNGNSLRQLALALKSRRR
ncbi:MAG: thioredoxin family protein [Rudaea sp.]|nr:MULTISPECIES: thioredoxin family protein [unclassified Rudaea]MBN8886482.1 thioredoxin family protein [Rudaea sp.]MBR0345610.1 thioredoxin family protein [Rudaea sp.]